MGLDIYVGSLSRYASGDWKTAVAQAAEASGVVHCTLSVGQDRDHSVPANPAEIDSLVLSWKSSLAEALGLSQTWEDAPDMPYVTDKLDWAGYGGLVLLAARLEHPELASPDDDPAEYENSPAFQAATLDASKGESVRFPSLLSGVEWWLPLTGQSALFEGPKLDGEPAGMATLDLLTSELTTLVSELGLTADELGEALIMGPPDGSLEDVDADGEPQSPGQEAVPGDEPVDPVSTDEASDGEQFDLPGGGDADPDDPHRVQDWGRYGLAVFTELCGQAQQRGLPLLLDH